MPAVRFAGLVGEFPQPFAVVADGDDGRAVAKAETV